MERRNLALLCAGVLCFWLFALAVGTAQGAGLRVAIGGTGPAVQADAPVVLAAAPANSGLQLECRAAILMEPETGRVLYEKAPDAGERTRLPHGRQPDLAGARGAVHAG